MRFGPMSVYVEVPEEAKRALDEGGIVHEAIWLCRNCGHMLDSIKIAEVPIER